MRRPRKLGLPILLGDEAVQLKPVAPKLTKLYELDCRKRPTGIQVPAAWKRSISTPAIAAEVFYEFTEGKDVESLMAIFTDSRFKPIAFQEVARGAGNVVHVSPRDLFQAAMASGASAFIMSHNHPSGDPTPSPEDRELTVRIRAAGDLLGIKMLDHLVVGEGGAYSFQENRQIAWKPKPQPPPGSSAGATIGTLVALFAVGSLLWGARRVAA